MVGSRLLMCAAGAALAAGLVFSQAQAGDAAKGKTVFEKCAACHKADTTERRIGPGLKGLFKKAKLHDGKKVSDASVMAIVDAGGGGMPAFKNMLKPEEKTNLLAYLKTL